MTNLKLLILLGLITMSTTAFAKESSEANQALFKPVQLLFAAVSGVDHDKMRATATVDFQLLEVGEDWTMDDFIKVVKPSKSIRRNYFSVIKSNINANSGWVSYWNKATFTQGEQLNTVAWLESAVLVKEHGGWKIQMLHSTRIKAEDLPKDIVLTEFKKG